MMRAMYCRSRQRKSENNIAWRRRYEDWYEPQELVSERRHNRCHCDIDGMDLHQRRDRFHYDFDDEIDFHHRKDRFHRDSEGIDLCHRRNRSHYNTDDGIRPNHRRDRSYNDSDNGIGLNHRRDRSYYDADDGIGFRHRRERFHYDHDDGIGFRHRRDRFHYDHDDGIGFRHRRDRPLNDLEGVDFYHRMDRSFNDLEGVDLHHRRNRCHCDIEGISLQLTTLEDKELSTGSPVIFDQVLTDNSWYLNYDEDNGVVEIRKHGMYMIDWDIAVEGASEGSFVSFALEENGEVNASSTLPETVGQLKGQGLVHVTQIPTTIRLINHTGDTIQLSKFTPIANFRIVSVE